MGFHLAVAGRSCPQKPRINGQGGEEDGWCHESHRLGESQGGTWKDRMVPPFLACSFPVGAGVVVRTAIGWARLAGSSTSAGTAASALFTQHFHCKKIITRKQSSLPPDCAGTVESNVTDGGGTEYEALFQLLGTGHALERYFLSSTEGRVTRRSSPKRLRTISKSSHVADNLGQ